MFFTAPGVTIPFPERINEEYQIYEGKSIRANISFEKLNLLINEFYHMIPEPLFLVIQLPLSYDKEQEIGNNILHHEILYLDGQSYKQIESIMHAYGQVLLCDGISQFGIASHQTNKEIFIQKYKLVDFFTKTPLEYAALLEKYAIKETQHLLTVWDTLSNNTPGECRRICIDGMDAFTVVNELKKKGMYQATVIEA